MTILTCSRTAAAAILGAACLLAFTVWSSPGKAQAITEPGAKPANYTGEAVVIEQYEVHYHYNMDGTGETDTTVRVRIQNEAGVRQFGVLSFPFAAATESPQIQNMVAHHADGTSTDTPASDGMELPSPVTQEAPLYSDLKTLQIPVRSLRAGDVLDYKVRILRKDPEAPAQFWGSHSFLKGVVILSEKLTLDVPEGKAVQVWSAKTQPQVTTVGGRRIWVWQTSQPAATAPDKKSEDEDASNKPTKPDAAWTTFHSWADVGKWYSSLATPRAVPNDAIKAQADEITRDAKTPEDQLQAIYSFVSQRIRYVGIDFGVGRYQPHAAGEVLVTRYGDCKDKDTLFEALLRAKGILSSPALIGVNLELEPDLPSPAFFNHVITAVDLPAGRKWADTTPGVTPLGLLVLPLRDKQALLIPATGDARLERTPAQPPFPFSEQFEAKAKLTKEGNLTGHVDINYRSDSETLIRAIAVTLAPVQWDKGTQFIANALGFSGTTSNSKFDHLDDNTQPLRISYDYTKEPFGDWGNFRIVPLFPVNALPAAPEKEPSHVIDLGAPRTEVAICQIQLPAGFGADLPDAIHAKSAFATFDKTYRVENGELTAQRQMVVLESKVPAKSWEEYKKFADAISLGTEQWIQLTSTSAVAGGPQPPKPGEDNPAAAALIAEVVDLDSRHEWTTALEKLDAAKKLNPNQPFLWSNFGYIAMMRGQRDEADEDFRRELSLYPKEVFVVRLYASFLMGWREADKAQSVLQAYFDVDPSDPQVGLMLAGLQARTDEDRAVETMRKTNDMTPGDINVQTGLADLLIRAGKKPAAAEIATKVLSKAADDPNMLNNGAYVLAEAGGDLALAEKSSRHSLEVQESNATGEKVGEANQNSFNRTSTLVASWDTLGYILTKEKKQDEAIKYLEAAWNNGPGLVIGVHYGEALEAAGHATAAGHIYELAQTQVRDNQKSLPDAVELKADMANLHLPEPKKRSALPGPDPLQEARTFTVPLPSACKSFESATLRLQFTSSQPPEILLVGGAALPQATLERMMGLKFPRYVPEDSKATILRDAIFTCSASSSHGELVVMPLGGIAAERTGN